MITWSNHVVLSGYRRLHKIIRDMNKHLQTQDKGPWQQNKVANLDRALGELIRILDKNSKQVSKIPHHKTQGTLNQRWLRPA